jgi:hypothetical protein
MGRHTAEPDNTVNIGSLLMQVGRTYLCFPVTLEHQGQRRKINKRENVLCPLDILPLVCESIQLLVDPDMRARIHKRARAANNLFVVSFTLEVDLNLLHIRSPVDLGVWQLSVFMAEHVFS